MPRTQKPNLTPKVFRAALAAIGLAGLVLLLLVADVTRARAQDADTPPTIASDKVAYSPGETIVLTGANWLPGEAVTIVLCPDSGGEGPTLEATADDSGSFTISTNASEERAARAMNISAAAGEGSEPFMATATGAASRATAQGRFTEGHARTDGEKLLEQESYWLTRHSYPTGRFNPEWVRRAVEQDSRIQRRSPDGRNSKVSAESLKASPLGLSTTAFTALGPQPERMTGCSGCFDYTTTSGRVNSIVVDPTTTTNGSIVAYAAAVGGGVWKTTNCCSGSTTWTLKTDDPLIPTTSVDSLALDPNDHNTIYAGTGDLNYGSFSMGSQGILKSTDGGATWTVLGADVFGAPFPTPPGKFPQYQAVGKVRVDPNASNKVVAGTKTGLYLSYDGGNSWTGPCLTNGFTSMRQDITGLELSNVGGTTRIIAAVGVRGFATTVQYDLGQNGANGLYKGTMPATGCPTDFTSIAGNANGFIYGPATTTYPANANMNAGSGVAYAGTSTGDQLGRIDIAVAPSDPNVIYAQVQSIAVNTNGGCGSAAGCQLGAWVTTDAGATWTFMTGSAGQSLLECANSGPGSSGAGDYPQNWYDQAVVVDPNNADRVFFDTFDIWLATRTGTTWYDVSCGYSGPSPKPVHVDQHALAFVPGSSSLLIAGNDGGVHGTANADAAVPATTRPTWFNMDGGMNTIEFYSGDISGNFATAASPQVNGGAQDNGPSSATFVGSPTGPVQWQMGLGGDGFFARIDPVGVGITQAQGTITLTTGGALEGETFVIGPQTFTWQVAPRAGVGQVQINSSTTTAGNNIVAAVNADLAGVVTAARTGATVVVTAVVQGVAGNSIIFTESSTNMTMNGSGTLGGTLLGGLPGSLRFWQGNNSGGLSRCIFNCTVSPATWTSKRGAWTGDQQSFILPFELFHGDPGNPANDCGPAAPGTGCGHLIAGTVRVWETITGAAAGNGGTVTWYVNSPDNLTKGTLGNRSFINQLAFEPKDQNTVIVGTNDGNVQIGQGLGAGFGPVRAAGAITLTTGGALAGETFVIGPQTFTFQVGPRAGTGQVQINSSTTTEGNNIVAAVNADLVGVVTAARSGAVVTVTAANPGTAGNSITFTEAATNFAMNGPGTLGGTTLGVDGVAVWVDVTGGNTVLPNRPILDVAFDPTTTTAPIAYAAAGGFNANTPDTPGHVFRVECTAGCASFTWADKSGNLPDIPVDSIIANPNFPQQVFAGTDFGLYYTDNVNHASPIWYRFSAGLPAAMIWDMAIDRGATTLALFTRGSGAFAWPLTAGPINNHPPTMKCKNVTVSTGPGCTAAADINDGSFDVDDDPISLVQSPPGPYPLGDTTVTLTATDPYGASSSCQAVVTVKSDVALSPASAWIGLKNSDDVGTNFDLLAEVFRGGVLIGSGQVNGVSGGSSGFNNAVQRAITLSLAPAGAICTGDTLSFKLSVRIAATGHRSGTARLYYNDGQANSRFGLTVGGTGSTLYLRNGFALGTAAGPGPKLTIDVFADRLVGGNPWKAFGTWSKAF